MRALGAILLVGVLLAGCSGNTLQPAPAPSPAPSVQPRAEPTPPATAPPATAQPAPVPHEPDPGPPPLRAGVGTPVDAGRAPDAAPCNTAALRAKLEHIVGDCQKPEVELCGGVAVERSDGGVAASFDLSSTTGVDPFASCVTERVARVPWECLAPGETVRIDLGCKL